MTTPRPHDVLFKTAMRDPARAVDLLRLVLAPEMFAKLDPASVEVQPGSWVDEELEEEHSDLLLSGQYADEPTLIYVLLEHKSSVEPWVFMQMLGYMVAIWNERHAASPAAPPPPILPVLISHAEGGWTGPVRLADLFGAVVRTHSEWAPFIPDFDVVHEDLHRRDDASLRDANLDPGVVMALVALRDARRADILGTLRRHMAELRAVAEVRETLALFRQLVRYLVQVVPELPLQEFRAILVEASSTTEEILPTLAEQWLNEGRAEGRAEGLREMLRKLLAKQFQTLTAEHEARIDAASLEDLERFVERVLSADTIDAVLAPSP